MSKGKHIIHIGRIVFVLFATTCLFIGCKKDNGWESYLCNVNHVNSIYTGILSNNKVLAEGEDFIITYDFKAPEYEILKSTYDLETVAGTGSDFQKGIQLMDAFSSRLKHASNYDNHIECNAIDLLDYSLDNKENGINCLNKAKILCEMCLALEIPARRVHIYPYDYKDADNHVVTEIYDDTYDKWIMLDMSNNIYFIDENMTPLSMIEIRNLGASDVFLTAIHPQEEENLEELSETNKYLNTYFMKNACFFFYDGDNGFGLAEKSQYYYVIGKDFNVNQWYMNKYPEKAAGYKGYSFSLISEKAVTRAP